MKESSKPIICDKISNPICGLATLADRRYIKEFLDHFHEIENERIENDRIQKFELFEMPPFALPMNSPIFIFEKGKAELRAVARYKGCIRILGYLPELMDLRRSITTIEKRLGLAKPKNEVEKEIDSRIKRLEKAIETENNEELKNKLDTIKVKNATIDKKIRENILPELMGVTKHWKNAFNIIETENNCEELFRFCKLQLGVRGVFGFDVIYEIEYKDEPIKKGFVQDELFNGSQPYAQGFPYSYLDEEMTNTLIKEIEKRTNNWYKLKTILKIDNSTQ
jgi:hypothetical protein